MIGEADTCRLYVEPRLEAAGWNEAPNSYTEQVTFTDGRIIVGGNKVRRRPGKRADYILRLTRDFPIAVVEAKAVYKLPSDGLQQAKDYAAILDMVFAYSTNGRGIVEFDFSTGVERELADFPSPEDLWSRYRLAKGLADGEQAARVLTPGHHDPLSSLRYYQQVAVNRTVQSILSGRQRLLLTMATGTGKTLVAFQVCWRLWSAGWSKRGGRAKPRILYLADRNILVDDPKDKTFAPFGDARWKIEGGDSVRTREMYFSTYQSIAEDESRPGLFREYPRDFFDLVIVDEAHRGSANDEGRWREILEWFSPAAQLGMTATPLREENRNTYEYFGNPVYRYSLRDGIDDGFLAPYRVHRVVTSFDATGWRPSAGEVDRFGRLIPDSEYRTSDFERLIALKVRTEALARHLSDYLRATDPYAKTIVFCVDQEHADAMRRAIGNLNQDLVKTHSDYVCRVTADEGLVGRAHLGNFQAPDRLTPVVLTTSQLLTTGVDAPTTKNIVLARTVNSMVEFKQIIGRGSRVRDDYGKLYFTIIDYTGSATRLFADPEWDGDPSDVSEQVIDDTGANVAIEDADAPHEVSEAETSRHIYETPILPTQDAEPERRKFYVDGGSVEIVAHLVYELDPHGKQLRVVKFTDYTAEQVRTLFPTAAAFRQLWQSPDGRASVLAEFEQRGVDFAAVADASGHPEADPLDLLCNLAFSTPLRSRRERADRVRQEYSAYLVEHGEAARAILDALLVKYEDHGVTQFEIPEVLKVPPISNAGNVAEIADLFGGPQELKDAVIGLQQLLYAA